MLKSIPGLIETDDLPDAPKGNFLWASDAGEVGQVLHAYQSAWLSQKLLEPEHQSALVDALIRASQTWTVTLHCIKGLAGAQANAHTWTKDTAMNPAVLDAFALAIMGADDPPAYPGVAGHEPDVAEGQRDAQVVGAAMAPLQALAAQPASYLSEADYFETNWQMAFWGKNYERLMGVKDRYDPGGLFLVHHGVGSEAWSADGFTKDG